MHRMLTPPTVSGHVLFLIDETNARLKGHFKLASLNCGYEFFEMWWLYTNQAAAKQICQHMAQAIKDYCDTNGVAYPEYIVGPARGAIWIAFLTAIMLSEMTGTDVKVAFAEKDPKRKEGDKYAFVIPDIWKGATTGKRVAVVEDVTTSGGSSAAAADLFRADGADVMWSGVILSRKESINADSVHAPVFHPLAVRETEDYHPSECTKCIAGLPHDNV